MFILSSDIFSHLLLSSIYLTSTSFPFSLSGHPSSSLLNRPYFQGLYTRTPKGMFLEVFCYIKPTKKHGTFGGPGRFFRFLSRLLVGKSEIEFSASEEAGSKQ